jgi:hypothetical protein
LDILRVLSIQLAVKNATVYTDPFLLSFEILQNYKKLLGLDKSLIHENPPDMLLKLGDLGVGREGESVAGYFLSMAVVVNFLSFTGLAAVRCLGA